MREYIKLGGTLFLITAVVALALAFVNRLTQPNIQALAQKAEAEAVESVFGCPINGEGEELAPSGATTVTKVVRYQTERGECYGVTAQPLGYGGAMKLMVGVNSNLEVTGVRILEMSETPGLGARVTEPDFYEQYVGKTAGVQVVKSAPGNQEIQAVSGATISSRAVTEGVNDSVQEVQRLMGGEVNE